MNECLNHSIKLFLKGLHLCTLMFLKFFSAAVYFLVTDATGRSPWYMSVLTLNHKIFLYYKY